MKKKEKTEKQDDTNLPQLPKNWKWVKLGDVAENIQYGYTESANSEKIGPKFLRITDIQDNKVNWDDVPYCKISVNDKNKYLLQQGDLLFARTGATVGKSFLIKTEIPESIFASYLIRVRIFSQVNVDYIAFFFHSPNYWEQIKESESGIGQPNVNGTKLAQLTIPLPPLSEQQRIVTRIEYKFSEIDHGIEKLKMVRSQLKKYRQSVLKAAFEGKLGLGDETTNLVQEVLKGSQENVTPISTKSEATASSKKPIAPHTKAEIADLPQLPKDWNWVKLGEVAESMKNGIYKPAEFYGEKGIACLRMYNIQGGKIQWYNIKRMILKESEIDEYELLPGDLLVNRVNSKELVGKTALITENLERCIYESKNIRLRLFNNIINSSYTNYWILFYSSEYFSNNFQQTAGMASINQDQLSNFPLPIPPSLAIQHQIVTAIENRISKADRLEEVVEDNLNKAEKLKQSILKKAFQGELSEPLETDENVEEMLAQLPIEKDNPMKKVRIISEKVKKEKITLEKLLNEKFNEKPFTFEDIQKFNSGLNYDEIKDALFKLLDSENFLRSFFDEKTETIKFELIK